MIASEFLTKHFAPSRACRAAPWNDRDPLSQDQLTSESGHQTHHAAGKTASLPEFLLSEHRWFADETLSLSSPSATQKPNTSVTITHFNSTRQPRSIKQAQINAATWTSSCLWCERNLNLNTQQFPDVQAFAVWKTTGWIMKELNE